MKHNNVSPPRWALDIGSTVVKLAELDSAGSLASQLFFPRDFEGGIGRQVERILAEQRIDPQRERVLVCSSANGGLRVGIAALSPLFSGAAMRNQVLLAGANPVFVVPLDDASQDTRRVDVLLVGGGIDEADAGPAAQLLGRFDPDRYRYGTLVYCGNRELAQDFHARHPSCRVIANPLGSSLSTRVGSVFEAIRRAYLDDLVLKEGISELPAVLARTVRPTPEVASRGLLRSLNNQGTFQVVGSCVVLDIGGATTDVHYTVECIADDSPVRPASGVSVARYVFTDLGIVASRDTLMLQLRSHPKLYELLSSVTSPDETRDLYASLREGGDVACPPDLLSYACLFLALDRFAAGHGPGLPTADLSMLSQLVLTGGAAQALDEAVAARVLALLLKPGTPPPLVQIDRRYEIWVAGITYTVGTVDDDKGRHDAGA